MHDPLVEGRRYETLHDVFAYCYHVAGVVGPMMSHVMDARVGRVYLPLSWLRHSGIAPEELADPRHREALGGIVGCLPGEAGLYYASADLGVERLRFRSAWAVAVARGVYKEIGKLVLARGLGTAIAAVTVGRRRRHPPRRGLWTRGASLDETAF